MYNKISKYTNWAEFSANENNIQFEVKSIAQQDIFLYRLLIYSCIKFNFTKIVNIQNKLIQNLRA